MMITVGEFEIYKQLKDECEIIFDIGAKDECFYIDCSTGKEFHLFEPNPDYYLQLIQKYNGNNANTIYLNNFGIGNKTEVLNYYPDGESFLKRFVHFKSYSEPLALQVVRLQEYLFQRKIEEIDFLKIDVEGLEPDILLDNIEFIDQRVKYVQFEYASTWLDRVDRVDLIDIYNAFKDFTFYFLVNPENPLSKENHHLLTLVPKDQIDVLENYMRSQYGFEILMTKRKF